MNLTFEDNDEIFTVCVREGTIIGPHTGYRRGNSILLTTGKVTQWIEAVKRDDFTCMREIINSVLDFDSYQLQNSLSQNPLLSYTN